MKKTALLLCVALVLSILLSGCSVHAESVTAIEACEVEVGETISPGWMVLPEDTEDKSLTFSSSDDTVAAIDESGNIEGVAQGSVTVTATTENGISAEVAVTVTLPVMKVTATGTLTLDVGKSGEINAHVQPTDATAQQLLYESADSDIATVDVQGTVTALAAGQTTITATAHNGLSAKTVVVVEIPVLEVILSDTELQMYVGGSVQLSATVLPEDATHQTLGWVSSDPEVATVDENGVIQAIKAGDATITATSANNISASCTVSIVHKPTSSGGTSSGGNSPGGGTPGNPQPATNPGDGGSGSGDGNTPPSGGGTPQPPTPSQLTDAEIQQAIGEAAGYAAGLGFSVVGDRQPGHGVASTAYYDYGAFVQNLKDNVNYVASLFTGEDLSLVKICFAREGNSVYVTYG